MIRFHIMTLFPEMVMSGLSDSILKRAIDKELIEIEAVNIRDFAANKHNSVDDYTYGGGAGMLMQAEPVFRAYEHIKASIDEKYKDCSFRKKPRVIYVTPQGEQFSQKRAEELSLEDDIVFLCGHYEGIDERVLEEIVTDYISIGDYVLTGGELPAMVMTDAVSRLVPGVLGNDESAQGESFQDGLLEYPQYSRPSSWHEKEVPEVLMSGNHKLIEEWRLLESIKRTKERRPDLYESYKEKAILEEKALKPKRRIRTNYFKLLEAGNGGRDDYLQK